MAVSPWFLPAALGLATASIAGAWGFQLFGGVEPCPLCLTQRIPYYTGIPVLAAGLILSGSGNGGLLPKALVWVGVLIFLIGAGYGVYHSGIEWGWWPGPASCAAAGSEAATVGDLLSQLETVRIIPCDEVQWRMFGLTFANYNVLISLAVAALSGAAASRMGSGNKA